MNAEMAAFEPWRGEIEGMIDELETWAEQELAYTIFLTKHNETAVVAEQRIARIRRAIDKITALCALSVDELALIAKVEDWPEVRYRHDPNALVRRL